MELYKLVVDLQGSFASGIIGLIGGNGGISKFENFDGERWVILND